MIRFGYLSGYTCQYMNPLANIKVEQLTHLAYSHLTVNISTAAITDGYDWSYIPDIVTAGHAKGIKVLLSLEDDAAVLNTVVADNTLRATLVSNIASVLATYNADGIDIDWEDSPAHQALTDTLITDLYAVLHPLGKIISLAPLITRYDISVGTAAYLESINLMTWNYGFPNNAPLASFITTMQYFAAGGFPLSKLLGGIPFFANDDIHSMTGYTRVVDALNPISSQNQANIASIINFENNLVTVDGGILGWNGTDLARQKVDWLKANGFGGTMCFDVGQDKLNHPDSLLRHIYYEDVGWPVPPGRCMPRNLIGSIG